MRGKGKTTQEAVNMPRITPAYAGKSKKLNFLIVQKKDHPRLCGEKLVIDCVACDIRGSPPPMRGKEATKRNDFVHRRITPAYAGKRIMHKIADIALKDHPRLCGEKERSHACPCIPSGSPPPMRGKGRRVVRRHTGQGITPAYAGKRTFAVFCALATLGSPPPMRGKGCLMIFLIRLMRITPAYAGKSISGAMQRTWT